jgi:peptide/nickel transport system permease protein
MAVSGVAPVARERVRPSSLRAWIVAVVRHPVVHRVLRRLLASIPLLFVVSVLVFVLTSIIPGNAAEAILGPKHNSPYPPSAYTNLTRALGLDYPLWEQYWHWLKNALSGDLGQSVINNVPVSQLISQRLPVTISLVVGSLLVSLVIGVSLGFVSAVRGGVLGRIVDVFAMAGWVLPVYWIAAELIVVFAVDLKWLPAEGYVSISQSPSEWLKSIALPVVALAIGPIGAFAKFTREGMLDALSSEYVRMARANGVSPVSIVVRHAFRSASLQVVTLASLLMIGLLIGTVFVEKVFALPGLGTLITTGVTNHDLPVVQAVAVFFTLIIVVINLVTDLTYGLLSPKVRVG